MNFTLNSVPQKNPVIPTGVRPSVFGWSNAVEEPAVRSQRHTACAFGKSVAFVATLGLILLWMPALAVAQTTSASEAAAHKQLSNVTTSLANGSVASIDILHMPDEVETRASVTPENLEKWLESRITISKVTEWAGRDELVKEMKSTNVASNARMPDLRSAVIFSDSNGKRIGALYFGRYFGRYVGQFGGAEGSIGSTPVSFKGNLANWLKDMIPSKLR
jgi:hypothetical protein